MLDARKRLLAEASTDKVKVVLTTVGTKMFRIVCKWGYRLIAVVFIVSALLSHILEDERKRSPHYPDAQSGHTIREEMKGGAVYITMEQYRIANIVGWMQLISLFLFFGILIIIYVFIPDDEGRF